MTLMCWLIQKYNANRDSGDVAVIKFWNLVPSSDAKPLPEYIPKPLRDDYYEACVIRDLSPKASATLARRCLQGIIRDFHGVAEKRLSDEIRVLKDKIDSEVWDSIDAVRKVGNIGAHMEADINVIVDVDPKEARLLISLIEQLFEEWYVNRQKRQQRMSDVKALAESKDKEKTLTKNTRVGGAPDSSATG